MKNVAILSSRNLSDYIIDESYLHEEISKRPSLKYELCYWDEERDWSAFDLVLIRTTWDYSERIDEFLPALKKIDQSDTRLVNPYAVVEWNSSKTYLKDLQAKGLPVLPSYFYESDLSDFIDSCGAPKYVIKPVVGASARDIQVLTCESLLQEASNYQKGFFIQPFREEVLKGETSYFYFGGKFSHAITKTPQKGDFRVQEEHGGVPTLHQPSSEELAYAESFVRAVPEASYVRVDALKSGKSQWELIELEMIEPSMFFRVAPFSAVAFCDLLENL